MAASGSLNGTRSMPAGGKIGRIPREIHPARAHRKEDRRGRGICYRWIRFDRAGIPRRSRLSRQRHGGVDFGQKANGLTAQMRSAGMSGSPKARATLVAIFGAGSTQRSGAGF